MNKLEDIELQIGDILTFDDGCVDYVAEHDETIGCWNKSLIQKIERYELLADYDGKPTKMYYLNTIWERNDFSDKGKTNDIEELEVGIGNKMIGKWEDGTPYCYTLSAPQRVLLNKLNEVIRKLNKKDSDK